MTPGYMQHLLVGCVTAALVMQPSAGIGSVTAANKCTNFERIEDFLASLDPSTETVECTNANIRGAINGSLFRRLTSLRWLRISGTRVSGSIPEDLATLHRLETLDLSNNQLVGKVPQALANLHELCDMDLRGNDRLIMSAFLTAVARRSPRMKVL